ncbi:MAG: hypothetical protein ACFCD0_07625 [Gemmataceae bacterium]
MPEYIRNVVLSVVVGLVGCSPFARSSGTDEGPTDSGTAAYRILPIAKEDNGYGAFQTQVIRSQEEWKAFQKQVQDQRGWHDKDAFLRIIHQARIHFDQESLVLIRLGDSSAGKKASLDRSYQSGSTLQCAVRLRGQSYNRDIVFRCFAVVVDKGQVANVKAELREGLFGKVTKTVVLKVR